LERERGHEFHHLRRHRRTRGNLAGRLCCKEKEARAELEAIAKSKEGRYLDAKDANELLAALEQTLKLEYVVLNEKGEEVGKSFGGGEPVKLKEGSYTLRILLAPQPLETKVEIKAGGTSAFTLKKEAGNWIF
jgi:hypothetical protein